MLQLFTLCLQAMTTPARSGLTNGVFAWLTSRDTKRRPLFTNTILATAGCMKWSSKRPCPLTLTRSMFCLHGKNACPPEDCGGIWGYYELLKTLKNPKHKEHRQMLDWLGGQFDPSHFDTQKINAELRGLGN